MKVQEFDIPGLKLIEMKTHGDARGFFVERYRADQFHEIGIKNNFIQENYSRSAQGVFRGLHYQYNKPQSKLVTCARGKILDIAVDIRAGSKTFGKYQIVELDGDKPAWFWVPAGFAHGFYVLSPEGADLMYKVDSFYNPSGEAGINWNDPDLKIEWPFKNAQVSPRDSALMSFKDYQKDPKF